MASLFSFGGLFKKKMTLEKLQKMKPQYTELVGVYKSTGGSMNGERYIMSIGYDEEGKIIYQYEASAAHYIPSLARVYEVTDQNAINDLNEYAGKYNFSVWDQIPDSDVQVLDGASTTLSLTYAPEEGEKYQNHVYIHYDAQFPDGCFEIIREFVNKINSYPKELKDIYLLDHDENKIYIGKDIENTDEEIAKILTGYFNDEQDSGCFADFYEGEMRIRLISADEIRDYEWTNAQIIHEQFKDCDSSWYVKYTLEEETLFVTATYDRLFIEDSQGNDYVMTRVE